ncbi:polysaccharide biosynthesis protein [Bacillus licheniformis]|nr:polysaccharide biosynthesis protein [Bacillus licheniformis]
MSPIILKSRTYRTEKNVLLMERYKPNVIYHAAAHKHVPLMENARKKLSKQYPRHENVAEAADETEVETFVLISSDKAVNPANIMGQRSGSRKC